uniref:Uncharacterized protein n=1 Tax=Panagrolaimus sp. ES5 TaxID=591445 RepID=A0AC34GPE6_9BILA
MMLGHTIWMSPKELQTQLDEFHEMAKCFENSVTQIDHNHMKSVNNLSKQNKEKVIKLAGKMNKNLIYIFESEICHEKLRIFPEDLCNALMDDEKNYEKVMKTFELLEENEIIWFIKLNGNIELKENMGLECSKRSASCLTAQNMSWSEENFLKNLIENSNLTVTITHLLNLGNNDQKFKELKEIIQQLKNCMRIKVLCEEEIKKGYNRTERTFKTQVSLYETIIKAKELLKRKGIPHRIQPNGTIKLNENLWVRAEEVLENGLRVVELSEKLKQLFTKEHNFQYGHPSMPIFTIYESTDEELYQFCYNMCELINEKYTDVKIEYISESNVFCFQVEFCNNMIENQFSIHPRSFFHMEDMDVTVNLIREYAQKISSNPNFLQSKNPVSNEEKMFWAKLWERKSKERLEFDIVREKCFSHLGKLILEECQKTSNRITSIGNISNVMDLNEKPYFGIENIVIKGEYIFKGGITNDFMEMKKGELVFKSQYNRIICEALVFAKSIDDAFKCRNLFDFQSVIELLLAFPEFFENKQRKMVIKKELTQLSQNDRHKEIEGWLKKVQVEQDGNWKYKFGNSIKGLHHWFKHDKGFTSIKNMYDQMNNFLENASSEGMELDTQNGQYIGRRYKTEDFFASYMIAHSDFQASQNCVATFYKIMKPLSYKILDTTSPPKYLIFADFDLKKFKSDKLFELDNSIAVQTIKDSNFISLKQTLSKMVFGDITYVEKIVFFIPALLNKEIGNLKTTVAKFTKMFDDFKTTFQLKFQNKEVMLFYSTKILININQDVLDIILKSTSPKLSVKEIPDYLFKYEDADDFIEYLQSFFTFP